MKLADINQVVYFKTSSSDIYTILTDERRHSSFTGDFVHIKDSEDEPFSLYDGLVTGKNIILEKGKKIVWSFMLHKPGWPADHFSEAAIILTDANNECRLELFHTAIPESFCKELETFWKDNYWEPLQYYLER
jgi:activator of HSP90 ATPase